MRMVSRNLAWTARSCVRALLTYLLPALIILTSAVAQETGTIKGTVSAENGAPLSGARVVITNKANGQTTALTTNDAGVFTSAPIAASDYAIRVELRSFISVTTSVTVKEGATATSNVTLSPEPLPGVINVENIDRMPVNGRNLLDYAQLEPGIQTRDAGTLSSGKDGFESLSLNGSTGRATTIEADHLSLTDETFGTLVQNIAASDARELRLEGLRGPISDQLTSPQSVNMVTRAGSDDLHGDLFGFYRNGGILSASQPGGTSPSWDRQQFGGRLGGALVPDKLFFFLDGERNRQDLSNRVLLAGPFLSLSPAATTIREPYRETEASGRLDYKLSEDSRAFYRFGYDQSSDWRPFGSGPSLQAMLVRTNTPSHTLGADFTSGDYTHSVRFEYFKFRNVGNDASSEVIGAANPIPSVSINIGGGSRIQCMTGALFCAGPSPFADQQTYQANRQFRYDGSRVHGDHVFHFGVSYNRISVGGFHAWYDSAPALSDDGTTPLAAGVLGASGLATDPGSYPVTWAFLGNGQGFATEKSAFGLPGGGMIDNQLALYGGDTWRLSPNLALTFGVHWLRDTGRSDADIGPIAALNSWGAHLGDRVRQPNFNFAPQLGVAWDTSSKGTTIIRAGIGLHYDDSFFTNQFLDRPLRLQQGVFATTPAACVGGASGRIQWPSTGLLPGSLVGNGAGIVNSDGTVSPYDPASPSLSWCGESMSAAAPQAVALQQAYRQATAAALSGSNPSYIANPGAFTGPYQNGLSLLAPNYQTPRTLQMIVGLQHELRPGLILSMDYRREVSTRTLLGLDVNQGGGVNTFDANNAVIDRDAAQVANGCLAGTNQVSCMVANLGPQGALAAYGSAGIGGPAQVTGGAPCPTCAFPGIHPNLGVNVMNFSEGRSVFSGEDISLKQEVASFSRGVQRATFQASYTHSRFVGQSQDQDFATLATDYANPTRFTGPVAFDRTHQVSAGATFQLKHSVEVGFIGHLASPLPVTLSYQQNAGGAEVLVTDWNGDGSTGDIIPGSNVGSYMRSIKAGDLRKFIANYNATYPNGTIPTTPAGNALVQAGVFSQAELQQMGGVLQPLAATVQNLAGLGWYKNLDLRIGWSHTWQDRITFSPSVSLFNVFNFANFDLPGNTQNGILSFGAGSLLQSATSLQPQNTVGGTSSLTAGRTNRAGFGSGMSAAGAPRAVEFGLKISF